MIVVDGIRAKNSEDTFVLVNGSPKYVAEVEQAEYDNVILHLQVSRYKTVTKEMHEESWVAKIEMPQGYLDKGMLPALKMIKKDFKSK